MDFRKIALIGGARPNFMKLAPMVREFKARQKDIVVINTGQHFSPEMNQDFLEEFEIEVDYSLQPRHDNVPSQISDMIIGLDEIFQKEGVDLVIVVGDVNSTLAASVCANKSGIKLAHVEAGLRSYNYQMPEEINRIVTDNLSDYLLAPSKDAVLNLQKEGVHGQIGLVGNIMIDNLYYFLDKIEHNDERYFFCTLHRAENVDDKTIFGGILEALEHISKDAKIYLPLHPRTKKMAESFGYLSKIEKTFKVLPSLTYKESIYYQKNADLILTDSGGIQEESTILNIPCLTIRKETERPITVERGTNIIAGVEKDLIIAKYNEIIKIAPQAKPIDLWDGHTAKRIVDFFDNL